MLAFTRLPHAVLIALLSTLPMTSPPLYAQVASPAAPVHQGPVPNERFYPLIFRHLLYLEDHAGDPTEDAAVSLPIRDFYVTKVGANEREAALLVEEAKAWQRDVSLIDKQAYALIDSIHAQTPGGHLAPGQEPPSVPPALVSYQKQKDAVTMKHVSHLHALLGNDRFTQIDAKIHREAQATNRRPAPPQALVR